MTAHEHLLIIDFGSQVTQLIARRVRESGVYCEIHPYNKVDAAFLESYAPKAIILSGGPSSVYWEDAPLPDPKVFELGIPVFGICYGQQAMVHMLGGKIEGGTSREFGRAFIEKVSDDPLFESMFANGDKEEVWMSHGDHVAEMAPGFGVVARSPGAPFAVISDPERGYYGSQFHPEVVHTVHGRQLLKNFTHNVAGFKGDWSMAAYRAEAIEKIRAQVGDKKVICGLSGGVDSSVAAVLIHEAIGDQLTCVYVDHGLMRLGESEQVVNLFRDHYNIPLVDVDASDLFLGKLEGVSDPEKKRKIIGGLFIDVFEEEAKKVGGADFLAQGTLYPDVIESVSALGGPSVTIKSHHNVGGLPDWLHLKVLEPLRDLYKDEVRKVAKIIGVPQNLLVRHPFPGPGLAVRIIGEVTKKKLEITRVASKIVEEELQNADLYDKVWQAYAAVGDDKAVGVVGDER
ncbi:MAG TPA: glutamine-hydrolyzing GMP synthase, partial [Hyphomonadaceae bacterium]|nr:glutamine-hydrolyzing GMP synthase [Hyphomonadaceae bacterium]